MTRATGIRRATPEDAEGVAAVVRGLQGENVARTGDFDANRARGWIKRLGDAGCLLLAADGRIPVAFGARGFVTAVPHVGLLGVWVLPDHRRRGLATDL